MTLGEFQIGTEFYCGGQRWRCTDVGSRVITAICLSEHEVVTMSEGKTSTHLDNDPRWFNGPPYAVPEMVFDEYDIKGCSGGAPKSLEEIFRIADEDPFPEDFLADRKQGVPEVREPLIEREAARKLAALGGTMPRLKPIPRRRLPARKAKPQGK